MRRDKWPLFRIIVPIFPHVNIYTGRAKTTTDLGSVMLATVANKVSGWRVEIIQENNYSGPRDQNGLPDHEALQRDNPATVVGFCCGLTSTIERVWKLASYYKSKFVVTIAGGWHAHYCPEETLRHNIDLVIHGDGEPVIQKVLENVFEGVSIHLSVNGCSYIDRGRILHNSRKGLGHFLPQIPDADPKLAILRNEMGDLDNLPYPDFGLLRHTRLKVYPIGRTRGCGFNCEFCSVKGGVHSASGRHLFNTVKWLVETRGARRFFIVDDRLEEDLPGTIEFLRLIAQRYGNSLEFTVQVRLATGDDSELIELMASAGVKTLCIGYESPIEGDLKAMHKGILPAKMLELTRALGKRFWIHAMFIFGYPTPQVSDVNAQQMEWCYKAFIRKMLRVCKRGLSIQILKPVPAIGTDLHRRLANEGRLFPLEILPWEYYDGNFVCFMPKNMTLQELQEIPMGIMRWFYSPLLFPRVCLRIIAFPLHYLIRGWLSWRRGWYKDIVRYAGSFLVQRWHREDYSDQLTQSLRNYWETKKH